MKLNFQTKIKNLSGEFLTVEEGKEITLGSVCVEALMLSYPDEKSLDGGAKYKRYTLAQKVSASNEETEVTVEDVAQLKSLIGKAYGPRVVGPAFDLLEGK